MSKAADIRFVRQEQIGEGRVAIVVEGDADEVERAVGAAKEKASDGLSATLVANVNYKVLALFGLAAGWFGSR